MKKIGVIVGSLRKESFNRKIAKALVAMAPTGMTFEFIEIGGLTPYNQDLDDKFPQAWVDFKEQVKACDAILFACPEYNRGMTGVLKNAIDIASRPPKQSVWDGKPCAIVGASPGAAGAFGAAQQLRQAVMAVNMQCLAQPEVYIGGVHKLLDERGEVNNEDTKKVLKRFVESFATWVAKF